MKRYGMSIDLDRCLGCAACLLACKTENEVPEGSSRIRLIETLWGEFPDVNLEIRPEQCMHCENPPCVKVCPTGATYKSADGLVLIDEAKCVGCKACLVACPYGARFINPDGGWAEKCTFCAHRLADGRQPACVESCPTGARVFGDLDDAKSDVATALRQAERITVAKPEAGTKPKLFYLGGKRSNTWMQTQATAHPKTEKG